VQRRISALPGVEHVSSSFSAPWRDDKRLNLSIQFAAQGARRADGQDFRAEFRSVSPGFFDTFGVPIQEGRDFNDGDKDGSERVSQSLAKMLYPG
jgi:putative ABC transport system permease protein